jgi:alkylation response protein AidB-like acyl-CoA dehydrogenase
VNFEPCEEQQALLSAVVRFLSERMSLGRVRGSGDGTADSSWGDLAGLGLFALTASPEAGGMGLSLADETLLFRELGRYLVTPCALATVIGRRVASLQGKHDLAARIMGGECRIALGFEREPAIEPPGEFLVLVDAHRAEQILIVSKDRLTLIPRSELSTQSCAEPLDESVAIETAALEQGATNFVCSDRGTLLALATLASAMLVGVAEAALGAAVDYAKQRQQFGVPVGSFQAIKHLCADNAVRTDAAWSQTLWAALALQESARDAPMHAAAAILLADDAGRHAAQDNVQIHGGMGFTAECDAHRYVKRRHVLSRLATHCIDAHSLLLSGA